MSRLLTAITISAQCFVSVTKARIGLTASHQPAGGVMRLSGISVVTNTARRLRIADGIASSADQFAQYGWRAIGCWQQPRGSDGESAISFVCFPRLALFRDIDRYLRLLKTPRSPRANNPPRCRRPRSISSLRKTSPITESANLPAQIIACMTAPRQEQLNAWASLSATISDFDAIPFWH